MFHRARVIAPLTAAAFALTAGLMAAGAVPATTPTRAEAPDPAVNLGPWMLQLPVSIADRVAPGCRVAEVRQPALSSYRSAWFRLADDGGVTLRANVEGCRTPGAIGARSELREMNGRHYAVWSPGVGTHVLTLRQAVTRLPRAGARLVVAQVHDRSSAAFLVKADAAKGLRPGTIGLCYEVGGQTKGCLDRAYQLGTPYDLTIAVSGGRVRVDYNGARAVDVPLVSTANHFKAGAYLQTNLARGATAGDYGEVVISRLGLVHTKNQPSTTPTTPTPSATSTPSAPTPSTPAPVTPTPPTSSTPPAVPRSAPYYLTGYSYWDNTPPGSADISHPVLHRQAGGIGTYDDPITVAVGHAIVNGQDIPLDVPGTRYYLVAHRRYLIVEDTCGDGPRPQDGPCYRLPADLRGRATAWLDAWVDGQAAGRAVSDQCMADLTGVTPVVKNPPRGLPVTPGPLC